MRPQVYSYANNRTATENEAIRMLEDDLGYSLKVIPKSQVDSYDPVWVLCMNDTCKRMVYVTPIDRKPHYSDYQKLIASAKKRGLHILPKIKISLDDFPTYKHTIIQGQFYIEFELKPTSDITLQYNHSNNPMTYTPGKLMRTQAIQKHNIDEYIKAWDKMEILSYTSGELKLRLGNTMSNEHYDFEVLIIGNSFTASITPIQTNTIIDNDWTLDGEISFELKGSIYPYDFAAHANTVTRANTPVSHINHHYKSYILLGIGVSALGLATFGVGDVIVLPAIGAASLAAAR